MKGAKIIRAFLLLRNSFVQRNKMKKIFALVTMVICVGVVHSQTSLKFCTGIDNSKCQFNNTKFITSPDSTTAKIYMMVSGANDIPLGTTKLVYKIYNIDAKGNELYMATLDQEMKPDWVFAWYPYTFNTPGKYEVKIYNDAAEMLSTKSFELFDKY